MTDTPKKKCFLAMPVAVSDGVLIKNSLPAHAGPVYCISLIAG